MLAQSTNLQISLLNHYPRCNLKVSGISWGYYLCNIFLYSEIQDFMLYFSVWLSNYTGLLIILIGGFDGMTPLYRWFSFSGVVWLLLCHRFQKGEKGLKEFKVFHQCQRGSLLVRLLNEWCWNYIQHVVI